MLFPYRVKNPPNKFPWATYMLIAINLIVYAMTTHYGIEIRQDVVDRWSSRWGISGAETILTAMFLHNDLFHILGNMYFLWLFGPAVEDRLGVLRYLGIYFLAGFTGDVAQEVLSVTGTIIEGIPSFGASGCVFGVLGAYLFIYPWSDVCVFFFFWYIVIYMKTFEIKALWILALFLAKEIYSGMMDNFVGGLGGVANFAHLGGAVLGLLACWILKVPRDTEDVSDSKALISDSKTTDFLRCDELRELVKMAPDNIELLLNYAYKASTENHPEDLKNAISINKSAIMTHYPEVIGYYLLHSRQLPDPIAPMDIIQIARKYEANNQPNEAVKLYDIISKDHPNAPECETALLRSAALTWKHAQNAEQATERLKMLLTLFPRGAMALDAEDLLRQIEKASV